MGTIDDAPGEERTGEEPNRRKERERRDRGAALGRAGWPASGDQSGQLENPRRRKEWGRYKCARRRLEVPRGAERRSIEGDREESGRGSGGGSSRFGRWLGARLPNAGKNILP
jgi:hypothetical protein